MRLRKKRKYVKSGKYSKRARENRDVYNKYCGKDRARIENPMPGCALPVRRVTVETLIVEIFPSCPRCGKLHLNMVFLPFIRPLIVGNIVHTHFSYCPDTHEPVVLNVNAAETGIDVDAVQDRMGDTHYREAVEAILACKPHATGTRSTFKL